MKKNIGLDLTSLPFFVLMLAAAGAIAADHVVEAELHENIKDAFVNPGTSSNLPKVLIIGDSISIGYTEPVRGNLKGIADVSRPAVNCQHSGYGLEQVGKWLGTSKWDVIHFNFGIWDTHMLDASGNLLSGSKAGDQKSPGDGISIRHTPEQYKENLTSIIKILKGTGAKLIWASSTPIMYRTGERFEDIPRLNRVAADVMTEHGIAIDDLYEYVMPQIKEWQDTDQCHFNGEGNKQLGRQVADCIRRAIDGKK